jgi:uncharacterized protein (DUF4415 family)
MKITLNGELIASTAKKWCNMKQGPNSPYEAAEAAFGARRQVRTRTSRSPPVSAAKETISQQVDRATLAFFQAEGPDWRKRVASVLRKPGGV